MDNNKIKNAFDEIVPDVRTDMRITAAMRDENVPKKYKNAIKRLAPLMAGLILLVGIGAGVNLYRNGGAIRFGKINYENAGGQIQFGRSDMGLNALDAIVGNVRVLTTDEAQAIFPGKTPTQTFGYFMTEELRSLTARDIEPGALYCVEAKLDDVAVYISVPGLSPKDTFAYDPAQLGQLSEVNGADIYGAYFITKPNSHGEQTVIYSTVFEKDGLQVETELAGLAVDAEKTAARITDITEYLTRIDLPRFTLSATWTATDNAGPAIDAPATEAPSDIG